MQICRVAANRKIRNGASGAKETDAMHVLRHSNRLRIRLPVRSCLVVVDTMADMGPTCGTLARAQPRAYPFPSDADLPS